MTTFSTREAARLLGIPVTTLSGYITAKKVPAPRTVTTGGITVHLWTRGDIDKVRKILPMINQRQEDPVAKGKSKEEKAQEVQQEEVRKTGRAGVEAPTRP